MKVAVSSDELKNIFGKLDEEITVNIKPWKFQGVLKKINSKMIKDKDGEKDSFKELTIDIKDIILESDDPMDQDAINSFFSFPDKKYAFDDLVKIDE